MTKKLNLQQFIAKEVGVNQRVSENSLKEKIWKHYKDEFALLKEECKDYNFKKDSLIELFIDTALTENYKDYCKENDIEPDWNFYSE